MTNTAVLDNPLTDTIADVTTSPNPVAQVLLNIAVDHADRLVGFFGYKAEHPLAPAIAVTLDVAATCTVEKALEVLFEEFNIGTSTIAKGYWARGNRALSVGDVVAIGDAHYAVERHGWTRLTTAPQVSAPLRDSAGTLTV